MIGQVEHVDARTLAPGDVFRVPTIWPGWKLARVVCVGRHFDVEIETSAGDVYLLNGSTSVERLPQPTQTARRSEP